MTKGTRWFALILVLAMVLTALAACGRDEEEPAAEPAPVAAEPAEPAAPAAEAQPVASTGDPAKGKEIFDMTCFACHGEGGVGVEGLGKDMTTSTFIHDQDDTALLEFLKVGRDPSHPDNTTGVAMPPKGGNPALTDEQLLDVIAYIRTLNANVQ